MEKGVSLIAKYGMAFIIIILIIVGVSFDFKANNFEAIIDLNQGKIQILKIIMTAIVSVYLILVAGFQVQLKEKDKVIESQNNTIIDHNLRFISGLDKVTVALNKNSAKDNETALILTKLAHTVDKLGTRMEESENMLLKHDEFITHLQNHNAKTG